MKARGDHFIVECRLCKRVISQCRCPASTKEITLVICNDCRKKMEEAEIVNSK